MINGVPWARPPTWIHPHRPLLRNTTHRAAEHARRLGQQLHLALDHDTGGTRDTGGTSGSEGGGTGGKESDTGDTDDGDGSDWRKSA
jgi:hypothetical protein